MKKSLPAILGAAAMMGALPKIKIRNTGYDGAIKHYTPPRSMTNEEKEYYAKHKTLIGFTSLNPQQ